MLVLLAILLILFILVLLLFKKKMIFFIWILLIIIVGCLSFRVIKGYFPVSVGNRHFVHLLIPPKDLLAPIIVDDFKFYEKGFNKVYFLEPKYLDFYDCGFSSEGEIPSDYKFKGKIKFEFFEKDKKLFEEIVIQAKTFTRTKVSLIHFEVPLQGKYKKDISVKVTVLEPDLELKTKESLKLYIAVSGTP